MNLISFFYFSIQHCCYGYLQSRLRSDLQLGVMIKLLTVVEVSQDTVSIDTYHLENISGKNIYYSYPAVRRMMLLFSVIIVSSALFASGHTFL